VKLDFFLLQDAFGLQFDDSSWMKHITSLKPLVSPLFFSFFFSWIRSTNITNKMIEALSELAKKTCEITGTIPNSNVVV
jgi:hypothetical protein